MDNNLVFGAIVLLLSATVLILTIAHVRLHGRHRVLRHDYCRLRHNSRVSAVELGEGTAKRRIEYARRDHDQPAD